MLHKCVSCILPLKMNGFCASMMVVMINNVDRDLSCMMIWSPNSETRQNFIFIALFNVFSATKFCWLPVPVAARLVKSWVRIPRGPWLSVVSVVCCQVEVSATNWSLVQRSPTEWRVVVCDQETSWTRSPWPAIGPQSHENKQQTFCWLLQTPPAHPSACCVQYV
jgi:hypothetical protein